MKKELYIAYGANTNKQAMKIRCPKATPMGTFTLKNFALCFSGVANIKESLGSKVVCSLWEITKECERQLDIFEGFPSLYIKKYIKVEHLNRTAMFYIMADKYKDHPPSESYLRLIESGYHDFNLPMYQLDRAVGNSLMKTVHD